MNKTIGIDFKSVVSKQLRTKNMYGDNNEIPRKGIQEFLQKLKDAGDKIIIYSSEHARYARARREWLKLYKIPYDYLECDIMEFDVYIGNEAITFNGDWKETLNELKENDRYINK